MKRTIVDTKGPYPNGVAPQSDAKRPKTATDEQKG
jgi:hypothetical protein